MSWVAYYVEVSSRQGEEALQRRLERPRPALERIPKQRAESWRRLWARPWDRVAHRLGRYAGRVGGRRVTPVGR